MTDVRASYDHSIVLPTNRLPLDPDPELGRLRSECPVQRLSYPDGEVGWLTTSYAAGRAVLTDQRFSIRPARVPVDLGGIVEALLAGPESGGNLLLLDPPEHTRLRRLLTHRFSPRRTEEYRPVVENIVAERLDVMERGGRPADFVAMFAKAVPALTICEVLGVPQSDRERFEEPNHELMNPSGDLASRSAAMAQYYAYIREILEKARVNPGADLLSELVQDGELSDEEMAGLAFFLFGAGHHTTVNLLGLALFVLLSDRRHWEALVADPSLTEPAADELLRYLTINQHGLFARTALEDVDIDGVMIRAGEPVTVHIAAANRDATRFTNPDRFDPARNAAGHLAFGYGIHICLGQHLARLEIRASLVGLVRRFPTLRLAVPPDEVVLRTGQAPVYGLDQLMVAW
jgi:cytochrome P450